MRKDVVGSVVAVWVVVGGATGRAEDVYLKAPITELRLKRETLPEEGGGSQSPEELSLAWRSGPAYVNLLGGGGEAYLRLQGDATELRLRLESPRDVTGRISFPGVRSNATLSVEFSLPSSNARSATRTEFLEAKEWHYGNLSALGLPGAAWFRFQADLARKELDPNASAPASAESPASAWRRPRESELEQTFDIFSGGRALSENLQLDRALRNAEGGKPAVEASVDVSTLEGISTAAIDWKPLVNGLKPALDPLASLIPADQHAVFFASFQAMVDLLDEAEKHGTPVLELLESRSEDSLTKGRYEQQMLLGMSDLGRLLGPAVVASVACTGSDPYLRMGSDVAVLFETRAAEVLKGFVEAKQTAALKANATAKKLQGDVEGLKYTAVVSADRSVSSYLAVQGSTVIVANSIAQLQRIAEVSAEKRASLAASDEYTYFRSRYRRGEGDENAFLILTDATIRRWCSAVSRIADSRRVRARAALSALTAERVRELSEGTAKEGPIETNLIVPGGGAFRMTASGPVSETYGSLDFMTPIAELTVSKATEAEATAYRRFRDTYQRNWRQFFDPIAIRFSVRKEKLGVDMTVLPLIAGTEYREFIDFTKGGEIKSRHGDPHPESLLHVALGINPQSRLLQMAGGFASNMVPGLKSSPFAWLGGSISIYADQDSRWTTLARQMAKEGRVDEMQTLPNLPVAVHFEVKDGLGVTAFLTAFRAFLEQSAPGQTLWETRNHNEVPYVRVGPTESAVRDVDAPRDMAVYYAVGEGALVVTLNEELLKRSIDRRLARRAARKELKGDAPGETASPWLGTNLAMKADRKALDVVTGLLREDLTRSVREKSWASLPILNEWRRLFPKEDPVRVHEKLWGARLVCPAGGKYVWNEAARTMESTVCGHPAAPRGGDALPGALLDLRSASLGVTFEQSGLRARAEIERKAGAK